MPKIDFLKSQKPSQFKGEISKNRKNPQNLNAFQKKIEFMGVMGDRGAPKDGPGTGAVLLYYFCIDSKLSINTNENNLV